jgi:hypothetical protein
MQCDWSAQHIRDIRNKEKFIMNRLTLIFLISLILAGGAFAQSSGSAEPDQFRMRIVAPGADNMWMMQLGADPERATREVFFWSIGDQEVIKNAPYTGTVVNESTQTLSDGNRIINKSSGFQARDSQGRTRREETAGKIGPLQVEAPNTVFISDPVAHVNFILQPDARTARAMKRDDEGNVIEIRKKLARTLAERHRSRANEEANADGKHEGDVTVLTKRLEGMVSGVEPKADVKHEDLGVQNIEGVACHGARETVTIPSGQIGNERPIVISTETWTSDDLHGIVLKKHNDPRFGETVYRLTNIKLGEPDASLFQPPNGFKIIKIESGESSFSFTKE